MAATLSQAPDRPSEEQPADPDNIKEQGVLTAAVLSLVPMIRLFQWESLLLPVGIQNKPSDLKIKTSNLVVVNVLDDLVKMCYLPALPRYKELVCELGPIHARLSFESSVAKMHPVYRSNEAQAEAATQFLNVMRHSLESLCADLRSHTITSAQSNNDRVTKINVSLLLKDSFIDSFSSGDQPYIKMVAMSPTMGLSQN